MSFAGTPILGSLEEGGPDTPDLRRMLGARAGEAGGPEIEAAPVRAPRKMTHQVRAPGAVFFIFVIITRSFQVREP